jgi:hypothetical protein
MLAMKKFLLPLLVCLAIGTVGMAADLPTVSVEHLYYLAARGDRIGKLRADEMVEYCLALKLGGPGFENLYAQLFSMRLDVTKLTKVEEILPSDPRVTTLNKTVEAYGALLREEAQKVQRGIVQEGHVANETLNAIVRAQNQR